MRRSFALAVVFAFVAMCPAYLAASQLMPSFSDLSGWTTDRYDPNEFVNVGVFQGRSDVLKIGIDESDGVPNRPAGQQGGFYNTQGRSIGVNGTIGDSVSADLYIPESWRDEANGSRRTDMWGLIGSEPGQAAYPIIGFTNYGGAARYRYWDASIGWVDLANAVQFNAWTTFTFIYNGTTVDYFINGANVGTIGVVPQVAQGQALNRVFLQAFNFHGNSFQPAAVATNYEAFWANSVNTEIPEPATVSLVGLSLLAVAVWHRRTKRV